MFSNLFGLGRGRGARQLHEDRHYLRNQFDGVGRPAFQFILIGGLKLLQNRKIATEDQAIVESSQPAEVPRPSEELSVRTDSLPLHFRKRYQAELRDAGRLTVVTSAAVQPDP